MQLRADTELLICWRFAVTMVMKMPGRFAQLFAREPRAMIGGSVLCCIVMIEVIVAAAH